MSSEYEHLHRNSKEGQIKILTMNALPHQRPFIKAAYESVVKKNKIEKKDNVDSIIRRIYTRADEMTEGEAVNFPEKVIFSVQWIKKISPLINKIRSELFSKEDPLFPNNPKKAFEWLKRKAKEEAAPIPECDSRKGKIIYHEIMKKMEEYKKLMHLDCEFRTEKRFIPYPTKSGWRGQIPVREDTPLGKLEEETKKISENYNFTHSSLIMYVLTGIEPIVLSYRMKLQEKKINIELHRPLRKGEINFIFQKINKLFGEERKEISDKHGRLYEFVETHGGPPDRKKGDFWDMVLKEWNEHNPKAKQYSNSNNVRITYNRLLKYTQNQSNILIKFMTKL